MQPNVIIKHGGAGQEEHFLAFGLPASPLFVPPARAAYGLIMRPNDFASYLLAIGICNLLLYFAFYIIMKVSEAGTLSDPLLSGERDGPGSTEGQ